MKLYYAPGVCSLSPHIVLNELGLNYDSEKVDLKTKRTETGVDYNTVAAKGAVPMLVLDNGEQLTEGAAIVQYLADLKPESGLAPKNGSFERVRLQEMLNYIASEFHKSHFPIFRPDAGQAAVDLYTQKIKNAYTFLAGVLKKQPYLLGQEFTVADAYAFTVLSWNKATKIDLAAWPELIDYQNRIAARPGVQAAMQAEGLLARQAA